VKQSLVAKLNVQRYCDHTSANDPECSRDPLWAVFGKERHRIAPLEILPNEPIPERVRASRKFLKRPALSVFLPEDHQGRLLTMFA
jgi:hypothetical protein